MFYLLLLPFFVCVSAENMCIDGEIYMEASRGPIKEYEPTVNNTRVITHPKNATLKSVGNKLCGFLIDTVDPATCYLPVTVKFIAIEFTESSRNGSYCTYYDDQAICVCDFFACNSVNGMLWEIAYSTMLREEHVIASPAPDGSYLGSLDERDRAASDCFMRLYEYSLGRNVTAAKRPTHYSPLAYRRAQLDVLEVPDPFPATTGPDLSPTRCHNCLSRGKIFHQQPSLNLRLFSVYRKNFTIFALLVRNATFSNSSENANEFSDRFATRQTGTGKFQKHFRLKGTNCIIKTRCDEVQFYSNNSTGPDYKYTVHEQLIRQLIGTLRIPFSTIYCRGKIDGGLRIQTPIFITGYNTSEPPPYIKLLIAMDPPIIPPRAAPPPSRESVESEKMLSQCLSWTNSCSNSFEDRRFVALVTDVNGKRVLPCRYLRPIRPPPVIEQLIVPMTSAETIGQVASYIPFLADPLLFPGTIDLWTTMEQFVSIGCGDEEEHAVFVCCWLLGLHIQCYLVLGFALPEGDKAAYVLVKLPEGMRLINPCDGNMYQLKDAQCPLLSIGTVVAQTNVYANVQSQTHPSQMNFDFTKSSDWKPVFDKEQHDLDSVQPSGINYQTVNEDAVVELRSSIEREIKLRFDEARQYAIPQWNLMASRLLREILQDSSGVTGDMVEEKLSRLRDSYSVTATAIRMPYE